jgi:hypothetical protein
VAPGSVQQTGRGDGHIHGKPALLPWSEALAVAFLHYKTLSPSLLVQFLLLQRQFIRSEQNGANLRPEALTFPALEPGINSLPGAEQGRDLAPGGSRCYDPEHALQDLAMR